MTDFRLGTEVDLAICMIDSISHLLDLDAMMAHLRAVRASVRPGGCYIVEGSHPAEYLSSTKRVTGTWDIERAGRRVDVRWGAHGEPRRVDTTRYVR